MRFSLCFWDRYIQVHLVESHKINASQFLIVNVSVCEKSQTKGTNVAEHLGKIGAELI